MARIGENITKRKDGRWEARYIKSHETGKTIYGYLYGRSYEEVKKKRDDIMLETNFSPKTKFDCVINAFLQQKKYCVKESTYAHYVWMIDTHIRNFFGDKQIQQLDSMLLEHFISIKIMHGRINTHGGLSPKTMKDILTLLKSIIRYGMEKGIIHNRSLLDVKPPKNFKKNVEVFSHTERQIIERKALSSSDLYWGIYLCLYTGLRIGEICALKWSDVDVENECLNINKTITRIKNTDKSNKKTKIIIDLPKSETSVRRIPLPLKILDCLKQRCPSDKDVFLLTGTSRFIEPRSYYEKYKKFLLSCNIETHTFHALRHTFATDCIEKGFDAKILSEILGHSDVKITLDRYVHPSWERKKQCMQLL